MMVSEWLNDMQSISNSKRLAELKPTGDHS